jgi:hypothetical protein
MPPDWHRLLKRLRFYLTTPPTPEPLLCVIAGCPQQYCANICALAMRSLARFASAPPRNRGRALSAAPSTSLQQCLPAENRGPRSS